MGGYLIDHILSDKKWDVTVTKLPHEAIKKENVTVLDLNILEMKDISSLLDRVKPDYIFYLAAQSSVALSWKNPQMTADINIRGSINFLEALRDYSGKARTLLIGSGEEYGHIRPEETPVGEENTLRPGNVYAATKAAQGMLGKIYADAYGLELVMVRAFNHIGPKQSPLFVVSDFCRQAAMIEAGQMEPVIRVGNLGAKRDFTDVRDVVKAYTLLAEKGRKGEIYNVGSGRAVEINEILNRILSMAKAEIQVEVEKERLRPVDVPVIEADIAKLVKETGWQVSIPLERTILETLGYWRREYGKEEF